MPTRDSLYDHPLYYDILFGWDRDAEAGFYSHVLQDSGIPPGSRILEVACGTGQVARRLVREGWRVTGLDNRPEMLRFLQTQVDAEGHRVQTICADMMHFGTDETYDAAFCPMSSFRILPDDRSAVAHLSCVANALRSDGVYILDLGFVHPCKGAGPTDDEGWSMARGKVTVQAAGDRVLVDDEESGRSLVLGWGESAVLREYTLSQFMHVVSGSGAFAVKSWHPETGRDENGVSMFQERGQRDAPGAGRAMVVLRRP